MWASLGPAKAWTCDKSDNAYTYVGSSPHPHVFAFCVRKYPIVIDDPFPRWSVLPSARTAFTALSKLNVGLKLRHIRSPRMVA